MNGDSARILHYFVVDDAALADANVAISSPATDVCQLEFASSHIFCAYSKEPHNEANDKTCKLFFNKQLQQKRAKKDAKRTFCTCTEYTYEIIIIYDYTHSVRKRESEIVCVQCAHIPTLAQCLLVE